MEPTHGPGGIFTADAQPYWLIEMSTVGPDAIADLRRRIPPATALLDAPVLGAPAQAACGDLDIFVGGTAEAVNACLPLLTVLGRPTRVGSSGAGAAAKLVANLALFTTLIGLGESLALASSLGLEPEATYHVLSTTPLRATAERRRPAIDAGLFPKRFALSLARKDADLIVSAGTARGLDLGVAHAVWSWLARAEQRGAGDSDYTAVLAEILNDATDARADQIGSNRPCGSYRD
jgi:3-hydroxyisobutyrate dehydrogenase